MRPRRRDALTARERLDVAETLNASGDVRCVINEFYPNLSDEAYESRRKLVLRWLREKDKLKTQCFVKNGSSKKKSRPVGTGTKLPEAAEEELVKWINSLRKDGVPISSKMLAIEAKDVAEAYNVQAFQASWRCERAFKGRHKLAMRARTRTGQKTPDDLADIAATFATEVRATMRNLGVKKVYNADQAAVFLEFLPTRTLTKKGSKTVWVRCAGKTKKRATAMLLGVSDSARYDPFIAFKAKPSSIPEMVEENLRLRYGFCKRTWKDVGAAHREQTLEIYGNLHGWWDSNLSIQFLKYHFAARKDMHVPILLLWDDFSGHWTTEVVSYAAKINVVLLSVPKSATSVCQPADVAWNFPFKARLREFWVENLRDQLRAHSPGDKFALSAPERSTVAKWIRLAWEGLSKMTISNGYRKAFGYLLDDADVAAADLIDCLTKYCAIDSGIGEVDSDDDIGYDDIGYD